MLPLYSKQSSCLSPLSAGNPGTPNLLCKKNNPGAWEYDAVDECETLTSYPGIHIKSGVWLHVPVIVALSGADDKRLAGLAGY